MKNYFIVIGIILCVVAIFFGSYLPFLKAQSYLDAVNMIPKSTSIGQFEDSLRKSLDFYSPVGQEEIVKFFSSDVINNLISQNNPEAITRELVSFIVPYLFKDNVRHLIVKGNLYRVLWQKYKNKDDFTKSEDAYLAALAIGPKLPPVLYSLLDLYREAGNASKVKEIGNIILKYWPSDENVKNLLGQLR